MSATKCRSFICGLITVLLLAGSAYSQTATEVDASRALVVGTKDVPPFAIKKPDGGWEKHTEVKRQKRKGKKNTENNFLSPW